MKVPRFRFWLFARGQEEDAWPGDRTQSLRSGTGQDKEQDFRRHRETR